MGSHPQSQPEIDNKEPRPLGALKVFLGFSPGSGKTAAMMQAAAAQRAAGLDVVMLDGEAAPEKEPMEDAATGPEGPETIPHLPSVEAVLARRPDIVIIDRLAGANPPGSRNPRHYHSAVALMEAGLDVYGTLNIYEIASRADILWKFTGLNSSDAVPDGVLDNAEISLVDTPPSELLRRLERGQFRPPKELTPATSRFFEEGCLLHLREMAARFFAERLARDAQQAGQGDGLARSSHRLLAAIEFGWEAEPLILLTRRLAGGLNAAWIVLAVETERSRLGSSGDNSARMLELARELGAEVITVADDDFVKAVLRVAASRKITQIVTAKTEEKWWRRPFAEEPAYSRLARLSGGIDIHIGSTVRAPRENLTAGLNVPAERRWQWPAAVLASGAVMGGGFLIHPLMSAMAASLMSLLAILAVAAFLDRGPALLATALICAGWDYFFLPPYFHFSIAHAEDKVLVAMYFTVALILGQYTTRLRAAQTAERQREERATALYLLTRELADASTTRAVVEKIVAELERSFGAAAAVLLPDESNRLHAHAASSLTPEQKEIAAASWAFERRQWAGKFTGNLSIIDTMFLPLESSRRTVGVLGLRLERSAPPTIHERNLLEALARQAAVALDRQHLRELSEKAEVVAASERLGKTLLDSMSHEIRTPIAAIQAAASDLAELGQVNAEGQSALSEIQEGAARLNRLVGQVLNITRLESGHVKPLINECEVADIINVAVTETEKQMAGHPLKVDIAPNLPIIRTDFVFLQQALMNLLANAAIHTPAGTPVELTARHDGSSICLNVADRGPGLGSLAVDRIFDKFYRGPGAPTGGIGLGLSLVKGFVKAVGGSVTAANHPDGGAEFTILLPVSAATGRGAVEI